MTDSALRTALYTVRSLGRQGVRVTVAERPTPRSRNLGALSRFARDLVEVPDNITDPQGFGDALLEIAHRYDVLVPIGMHSIEVVARRRTEFDAVTKVLLADWDTIARVDNTTSLLGIAETLGIPVPRSYDLDAYTSLAELAGDAAFPLFVKTGVEANLAPKDRYALVRDPDELEDAVTRLSVTTPKPIIQECIRGQVAGFEAVYDDEGRIVRSFCHRRLRQYPISGGPSTFCESVHLEQVEHHGRRLLDHLGWTGLAMVEFLVDERDGLPKLMEVNPRSWGSMALPIHAGVDFPWISYRLARGEPVEPDVAFPAGVRLRFLINDAYAALAHARVAGTVGERLRIFASLLHPRVGEGVLSFRDPLPSLAYAWKGIAALFRRSGGGPALN